MLVLTLGSCKNSQKVAYFSTLRDSSFTDATDIKLEQIIQKNDLLSITVTNPIPEAAAIFMLPNVTTASTVSPSSTPAPGAGFLVDRSGQIQFPILGTIVAAGLTKQQLTDTITARIKRGRYLNDPLVTVRFLNFRVTVLGEVAHPTVITVPNEKITILEALAQSGDLTIYARRDNILVIREENSIKITKRLNLNTTEIFSSPYYYLNANDIVYAEPNSSKISSASSTRQLLPAVLSGLSFLVIIFDRILRNN